MVSFSTLDLIIIGGFFFIALLIGFIPQKEKHGDTTQYLLSGRKVGLLFFIMTNVAAWYGGILGVGEFTYRFGLLSWVTQGLPYYIFAIIFALFLSKKIRNASLFTIPDKLSDVYGNEVGIMSSFLVFILVSPAPYLLMTASLFTLIFHITLLQALILSVLLSGTYLLKGGFRSSILTDVFQFIIMFTGFIIIVLISYHTNGGIQYLKSNLPASHLMIFGNVSPIYLIVWFLIALWTFADPGFHQRCYAAIDGRTAMWGILISVLFMALFDFLTTTTGLYARAALPDLSNPVLSFPLYAEKALGSGFKGIFFAALFATIISTLNSFLFLSGTTFGRDFVYRLKKKKNEENIPLYTRLGLIVSAVVAIVSAYFIQSVISLWYLIGSICIPGIIFLVFGAYYEKMRVTKRYAVIEIISGVMGSISWFIVKTNYHNEITDQIEPMIAGLIIVLLVHITGIIHFRKLSVSS
jgi:SSS family solute:Na+ symporter